MESEHSFVIVRGRSIREFSRQELLDLHMQISMELPENEADIDITHVKLLDELDLIEDELEKR